MFLGVTFVLPLSVFLARSLQQALWVGLVYVIVTPIGWRVLYGRL